MQRVSAVANKPCIVGGLLVSGDRNQRADEDRHPTLDTVASTTLLSWSDKDVDNSLLKPYADGFLHFGITRKYPPDTKLPCALCSYRDQKQHTHMIMR